MNTVDALKDLYKTLCGKDYAGDPNPTDAEMISAIAKDASTGGGSGSGGARIIDLIALESRREVDPEDDETFFYYFSGYEAGLSASDFINSWLITSGGRSASVLNIDGDDDDEISLEFPESTKPSPILYYIPETGEFYFVQQASGGSPK